MAPGAPAAGTVLDALSVAELRRLSAAGGAAARPWAPQLAAARNGGSFKGRILRPLAVAFLALGLFAVFGFVSGVAGAIRDPESYGALEWTRLALLGFASIAVASQAWGMLKRTKAGQALTSLPSPRLPRPRRGRPAPTAVVLDGVPVATLRRLAPEALGRAGSAEYSARRAGRITSAGSWWALVVLSLLVSAAIAGVMGWIIAGELDGGRTMGAWIVLPGLAFVVALTGIVLTLRTAIRSRRDRRQRRRLRLFRRLIGWITRSPLAGSGSGAAIPGMAPASVPAMHSVASRAASGAGVQRGPLMLAGAATAVAVLALMPWPGSATTAPGGENLLTSAGSGPAGTSSSILGGGNTGSGSVPGASIDPNPAPESGPEDHEQPPADGASSLTAPNGPDGGIDPAVDDLVANPSAGTPSGGVPPAGGDLTTPPGQGFSGGVAPAGDGLTSDPEPGNSDGVVPGGDGLTSDGGGGNPPAPPPEPEPEPPTRTPTPTPTVTREPLPTRTFTPTPTATPTRERSSEVKPSPTLEPRRTR